MTEFDNRNRGSLWKNQKKETEDQPDYRGDIDVDGKQFWLSAWVKTSGPSSAKRPNEKFFSLALTEKEQQLPKDEPQSSLQEALDGDEIPF